jgi:hypothetical protein
MRAAPCRFRIHALQSGHRAAPTALARRVRPAAPILKICGPRSGSAASKLDGILASLGRKFRVFMVLPFESLDAMNRRYRLHELGETAGGSEQVFDTLQRPSPK